MAERIKKRIEVLAMMEYNRGFCYGCNKKLLNGDGYCYRDETNGIAEDVHFCHICLLKHVEKHYGMGCPLSKAVRKYHGLEVTQTQLF